MKSTHIYVCRESFATSREWSKGGNAHMAGYLSSASMAGGLGADHGRTVSGRNS